MGARKREMAERHKEERKQTAIAKLNNIPTSPRKMRLVANLVRGVEVNRALDILKYTKREASVRLEKLLKSAIANWESKNEADRKELENGNVLVQHISVGQGRSLKRIRTAPQGRAARIRKRSNHVTIILAKKGETPIVETQQEVTEEQ
jgi:large subunit ribosomal protein L22